MLDSAYANASKRVLDANAHTAVWRYDSCEQTYLKTYKEALITRQKSRFVGRIQ